MITLPGKIPITIHPLFWLIALFIGWMWTSTLSGTLLGVLIILFSVIIHEYGHATTATLFGQKSRIELAAFGGFTYREGRKLRLWEEFIVVLMGPVAGFLLFLAAFWISRTFVIENEMALFVVKFTYIANLFWTLVNLVPVLPLDGGHLLSIALEALFGFKGVKIAIFIGIGVAIAASILFFILGMFIVGALFLILTFESARSLRYYKLFSEKDRDAELQELMRSADTDNQEGNVQSALQKLETVRTKAKKGILHLLATQEMAEILRHQEQYEKAYGLLLPIQKNLSGDSLALFHFLAYMNGDFKTVTQVGNKCYQDHPSYDTALINALAHAALAKVEPAVGWLECAHREGLPSVSQAIQREEFDPIRKDPRFLAFQQSHAIVDNS